MGLVRRMTEIEGPLLRIRAAGEDVAPLYTITDEDFDNLDAGNAPQAVTDLTT